MHESRGTFGYLSFWLCSVKSADEAVKMGALHMNELIEGAGGWMSPNAKILGGWPPNILMFDDHLIANSLLGVLLEEFRKPVNIWQSYDKKRSSLLFGPPCISGKRKSLKSGLLLDNVNVVLFGLVLSGSVDMALMFIGQNPLHQFPRSFPWATSP